MYLEHYAHAFTQNENEASATIKKSFIKFLTWWIFPSQLRKQAKRRLKFWLGMSAAPETLLERYRAEKARKQFIKAHSQDDIFSYKIVSLGCDCFARTIPTLWGLKPRKKQGEKGCPFDLSDNPLPCVAKYLQNDFAGYFDSLDYHQQLQSWWIAKDEIVYCHEDDCDQNSRETIVRRFSDRIDNLRNVLDHDSLPALFISHYNPVMAPQDINEVCRLYNQMFKTLQQRRQNRPFRFLIVDTAGKLSDCQTLLPDILLLSCPWLPQPYVWHEPHCRYKKTGLKFELLFIKKLQEILQELLSQNPSKCH